MEDKTHTHAAIPIAHGDPDGDNEDSRDGVRSAAKSGGHCATKSRLANVPITL